jgi:hypothetical protein
MEVPIIPEIQLIIEQAEIGSLALLVTAFHRPVTSAKPLIVQRQI